MPLARIISRRSEDALPLVEELHAQGYAVEVFAPDEPMEGDADVELVIEAAPASEAATLVQKHASQAADLFVAPGVMDADERERAARAAIVAAEAAAAQRAQREREQQARIAAERQRVEEEQRRAAEEHALQEHRRAAEELRRAAEETERLRVAAEQKRR